MMEKIRPDFWLMEMLSWQVRAAPVRSPLKDTGSRQRPVCRKEKSQVVGMQVFQGARVPGRSFQPDRNG